MSAQKFGMGKPQGAGIEPKELLSRWCYVPADPDGENATAARSIACSEQNPSAISTRTTREKWKITPSVQPNILSALPSSAERLPMDISESGLKTPL